MIVQTIWEALNYGASHLLPPNSTAIPDIPAKNSVQYKNNFFIYTSFIFLQYQS